MHLQVFRQDSKGEEVHRFDSNFCCWHKLYEKSWRRLRDRHQVICLLVCSTRELFPFLPPVRPHSHTQTLSIETCWWLTHYVKCWHSSVFYSEWLTVGINRIDLIEFHITSRLCSAKSGQMFPEDHFLSLLSPLVPALIYNYKKNNNTCNINGCIDI